MQDTKPEVTLKTPAVWVGRFESGSPEWHAARASGLGGSEVSAVVGLNPWESKFSLYYRKKSSLPEVEVSDPMKWGTLLEPVIYQEWLDDHLEDGLIMTTGDTYRHETHEWMIANPDGIAWDEETGECEYILEIKNVGRTDGWGPDGTDLIPINYRVQVMWYMAIMGAKRAVIRVLVRGNQPRTYYIDRSDDDIKYLIEEGQNFMTELADGIEPDITRDSATYQALRDLHPEIDNEAVDIEADLAAKLLESVARRKEAELDEKYYKSKVAKIMGHARWAKVGEDTIATRRAPSSRNGVPYVQPSSAKKVIQNFIAPPKEDAA